MTIESFKLVLVMLGCGGTWEVVARWMGCGDTSHTRTGAHLIN